MMKSAFVSALLPAVAFSAFEATLKAPDLVDFAQEKLILNYEVTNTGANTESFLPWNTPLDTLWKDLFLVQTATGETIPYTGKIGRRRPTTEEDYVIVAPGQTLAAEVDLTRSYQLPADGAVYISLKQVNATGAVEYGAANEVRVQVANVEEQGVQALKRSVGTDYGKCSGDQVQAIFHGYNIAMNTQIPNAIKCTTGKEPSCREYTTWFGDFNQGRFEKIQKDWTHIQRDLPLANYECCYDCGGPPPCGRSYYAYVYPNDPTMTQYMCNWFFDSDEQAETMTHEQSHFTVTAGTDDYAYGEENCKALARNNPNEAVDNADNLCYFGVYAETSN